MNRFVRRVFDAYALLLLIAVTLPPWRGENWTGQGPDAGPFYVWLRAPPSLPGGRFVPDYPRLLLEVLSLTLVLVLALPSLRDLPPDPRLRRESSRRA